LIALRIEVAKGRNNQPTATVHLSQENFTALDSSRSHAIRLEEEIEYLNV